MSTLPEQTDVVVAGAGPTGLVLSCVLAAARVPFVLVDRLATAANTSRAAVVHARTLEVLEELDVTERLRANGHVVPRFCLHDRDRVLATVPFNHLETPYPFTLMIPQDATEAILVERLRELGGSVQRGCAVTGVRQHPDHVAVAIERDGGAKQTIRARYVAGADGMHSIVRESAGIGFTGAAYEESFVLADVHMTWSLSRDEVRLFLSPDGLVVIAALPHDRYRVVATADDAPEHPDVNDVQRLLAERGPQRTPARVNDVLWSGRFRVHHRLANHYRAGRILIAGDAAHVHSPAGGQGMNTGIQDAVALGHALSAVILGTRDDTELDRYEQIRRPIAERVVAFTDRMTHMATLRRRPMRALRNTALSVLSRIPPLPRALATELAGLRNRDAYQPAPKEAEHVAQV